MGGPLFLVLFLVLFSTQYASLIDERESNRLDAYFQRPFIRIHTSGIKPTDTKKQAILESLLEDPQRILAGYIDGKVGVRLYENVTTETDESPLLLVTTGSPFNSAGPIPEPDVSVLVLDEPMLVDDDAVINRMYESLAALCLGNSDGEAFADASTINDNDVPINLGQKKQKRPLIILFSGSASKASKVESLLNEAWQLHGFERYGDFPPGNILGEMDVRILLVPSSLKEGEVTGREARNAMREVIWDCLDRAVTIDGNFLSYASGLSTTFETSNIVAGTNLHMPESYGIEASASLSANAYTWALQAANASVDKLNK
jgi:hypothetical protein